MFRLHFSLRRPPAVCRREIYEALRLRGTCESPYHGMVASLQRFAGLTVCGLLAEVADRSCLSSH